MDKVFTKPAEPEAKNPSGFRQKLSSLISKLLKSEATPDKAANEKKYLLREIEDALSDLRYARNCFEEANDPEMIEACIYEIKSAETRYSYLIRRAKRLADKTTEKISV